MFIPISLRSGGSLTATEAAGAQKARTEVELLRYDVERLFMINEALWAILKEQHGFDDNSLLSHLHRIDLQDGKLDGKVASTPPDVCPNCERTLLKNRPLCMYCGTPVATKPFQR